MEGAMRVHVKKRRKENKGVKESGRPKKENEQEIKPSDQGEDEGEDEKEKEKEKGRRGKERGKEKRAKGKTQRRETSGETFAYEGQKWQSLYAGRGRDRCRAG